VTARAAGTPRIPDRPRSGNARAVDGVADGGRLFQHDFVTALDRDFGEISAVLAHRPGQPGAVGSADGAPVGVDEQHREVQPPEVRARAGP
jgi:hypothetical protein